MPQALRKLALAVLVCPLLAAPMAHAANADYDWFNGVTASDVPYTSADPLVIERTIDNSAFNVEANELAKLGCGDWGAKTAWLRFVAGVSGRLRVRVTSAPGNDVFYQLYTGPAASPATLGLAQLQFRDCYSENDGVPSEEAPYSHLVRAGETVFTQVASVCAPDTVQGPAYPCSDTDTYPPPAGGPFTLRITFTPDDGDGDRVPDTLDQCPGTGGANLIAGCPDSDGDTVKDSLDCRPVDPGVAPGKAEIAGNGKDDNCDGRLAPWPRLTKDDAGVAFRYTRDGRKITSLLLLKPRKGMRVIVRCKSKSCPFEERRITIKRNAAKQELVGRLKRKRLAFGTKVTVAVIRPGYVGRALQLKTRRRRKPKVSTLCVPQGRERVVKCSPSLDQG